MVTIRNNSLELQDGDTISVDGTELTFRSSGELEFPDGETAISLSDIDGADIAPNSVDAVTDVTTSNVTTDALEADAATIANRQVSNVLGAHDIRIEELLLNQGLDSLDFDGGFVEIYANQDRVDSSTNIEGFNGSISLTDGQTAGSLTTVFETLGFVPNSVVLNQTADVRQDVVAENGEQFEYDIASGVDVSDASVVVTGRDSTSDEADSYSGLSDGDSVAIDVQGSEPANLTVEFSPYSSFNNPKVSEISDPSGSVSDVAISQDGSIAVIAESSDTFYVIERNGPANTTVTQASTGTSNAINSVGLSDDGSVATLVGSGDFHAVDLSDPSNPIVTEETMDFDNSDYGDISGDGSIGVAATGGYIYIVDLSDPTNPTKVATSEPQAMGNAYEPRLNYDGTVLTVGEQYDDILLYDLSTPSSPNLTRWEEYANGTTHTTAISDDGSVALYGSGDNKVYIVDSSDPANPTVASNVSAASGGINEVGLSDDGTVALAGSNDNSGYILDTTDPSNPSVEATVTNPSDAVRSVAVSGDGTAGLLGSADNNGYVLNITNPSSPSVSEAAGPQDSVNSVSVTNNGTIGLLGSGDTNGYLVEALKAPVDPSLSIDGQTASYTGTLSGESYTETLEGVSTGIYSEILSLSDGYVNVNLLWTETTVTTDPSVDISSGSGSQTVSHTGTISDGSTIDLSDSIDESLIDGSVTVSVSVSESVTSPVGQVGLEYRHEGMDAGGIINYTIEDGDGNSKRLPIDTETDISSFTSEDVRLLIDVFNGLANVTSSGFGVYLDGGN